MFPIPLPEWLVEWNRRTGVPHSEFGLVIFVLIAVTFVVILMIAMFSAIADGCVVRGDTRKAIDVAFYTLVVGVLFIIFSTYLLWLTIALICLMTISAVLFGVYNFFANWHRRY